MTLTLKHHSTNVGFLIIVTMLEGILRKRKIIIQKKMIRPPYRPQLNTCECCCFHIIKQILRSDSDFTFDHSRTAICDAIIDGVTFEKSENIF
jgi:hypothetical protein